jgi:hypothetical protein
MLEPVNLSLEVGGSAVVVGAGELVEEGLDVKVDDAFDDW